MADQSIVNLDPSLSNAVRYELGPDNWRPPSGRPRIPDLANPGATIGLGDDQMIDVLILGDGYETQASFESRLTDWLTDFYAVDVYNKFAGAFRVRALFHESGKPCSAERDSFYRVNVGTSGDDNGEVATGDWEIDGSTDSTHFRQQLFDSVNRFTLNLTTYPNDLDVGGDKTVIHNQLKGMYSNLVVVMLVRTATSINASGRTRAVPDPHAPVHTVNVAFGSHALHEFGHAFAYLEDEYITSHDSVADRANPLHGNVFTLSNLSFSRELDHVPWQHLSPWGRRPRQAAGNEPSPIVGWLWRGGEEDCEVWHSEYHCLMNGKHRNYAYSTSEPPPSKEVDLRFRRRVVIGSGTVIPPRYCLWCQEIVTIRILEKTGQLAADGDPEDVNERGRRWYRRWVNTWRDRYWAAFDVDQQIVERESLYANPSSEPQNFEAIEDNGSYKRLDKSDLYQPFTGAPSVDGDPPADDEDVLLAMLAAP